MNSYKWLYLEFNIYSWIIMWNQSDKLWSIPMNWVTVFLPYPKVYDWLLQEWFPISEPVRFTEFCQNWPASINSFPGVSVLSSVI